MPNVRISGMPSSMSPSLPVFRGKIQQVVAKNLKIRLDQVTVWWSNDQDQDGLGEEILVEFIGVYEKPDRTFDVLYDLQLDVRTALRKICEEYLPSCKLIEVMPIKTVKADEVVVWRPRWAAEPPNFTK